MVSDGINFKSLKDFVYIFALKSGVVYGIIIENFFINEVYVTVNNWSIPVDNFFIGRTIKVWKVHKKIVLHLKYGCLFLQ